MKRCTAFLAFLIFCSGALYPGWCGATSGLRVTDVTPSAFSLVWLSSRAATCSAYVYSDPQGNNPVNGVTIADESTAHPPAAQNGVMKVRVSGLTPGTTYYFQTVTTIGEDSLVEPAGGPLPIVMTESSSSPPDNDVLLHRILRSDGTTPALGALLLVEVEGADYPVTGWVEDYSPGPPWAQVDLNNLYSATTHLTLELLGGEGITVQSIGGLMGFRRLSGTVPEETGEMQTLSPEPDSDQCTLDNAGPIIDGGQLVPIPGAVINDSTPVISGAYTDQLSAIDPRSVRLEVDGVDVTGQAVVSSTGVVYTPLVPLGAGVHTVELFVADEWGFEALPMAWSFTTDVNEKGDVNNDKSIDLVDAILSLQIVAGIQPVTPVYKTGDVNGDGKIGLEEGIFVLQKVSGLRP